MLKEAIKSALAQEGEDFEVVVSDNCSTDHSRTMLQSLTDPRLKVVYQSENLGAGLNHRACLANSNGKWILFLHDDDQLRPSSLALVRSWLDGKEEYAVILPDFVSFLGTGILFDNCLRLLNGISPSSTIYRRDFLITHIPPPDGDCGDWEILVLAAWYNYKFSFYPFEYIRRRDHEGQESKRIIQDGSGNRSKSDVAQRISRLVEVKKWVSISERLATSWTTEELMTLARYFHHAGCRSHYRTLQTAAARRGKWTWVSAKGLYIGLERVLGQNLADRALAMAKKHGARWTGSKTIEAAQ